MKSLASLSLTNRVIGHLKGYCRLHVGCEVTGISEPSLLIGSFKGLVQVACRMLSHWHL